MFLRKNNGLTTRDGNLLLIFRERFLELQNIQKITKKLLKMALFLRIRNGMYMPNHVLEPILAILRLF